MAPRRIGPRVEQGRNGIRMRRWRCLRGASVADLWEPIAWLALYTSVILGLAVLRFKKTAA